MNTTEQRTVSMMPSGNQGGCHSFLPVSVIASAAEVRRREGLESAACEGCAAS
jgi:hypothetical protein